MFTLSYQSLTQYSFTVFLVDEIWPIIINKPIDEGYSYIVDDIHSTFVHGVEPRGSVVSWEPLKAIDNFGDDQLIFETSKCASTCVLKVLLYTLLTHIMTDLNYIFIQCILRLRLRSYI